MPGRGPNQPAFGLEYNRIIDTWNLSKSLFSADIARTPQVIKGWGSRIDVQGQTYHINGARALLHKKHYSLNKRSF